ncbi:MAG: isoprenyl transferase [Crocinitomicaceae bacterium]|jgi:undecaprenyl diphosphate synthase|nr:isoprenyl transferase [Crocinitomicaceae bacterium]
MNFLSKINKDKTPNHVAIIMDGNGRWAQQQGHDRLFGHNFGVESVREVLKAAQEINVKYLTLYAFSTENWNRPKTEVDGLMELLVRTINNEVDELHESDVIISGIGNLDGLPDSCRNELNAAYEKTKNNKGVNLILALNYSARWELTEANRKIAAKVLSGELKLEQITDEIISNELTTKDIPDPELLIRTSGELRISNFLLWQIAYAELYFTDKLWPDFKKEDFYEAILDYQSRERRFGMVSAQIEKNL